MEGFLSDRCCSKLQPTWGTEGSGRQSGSNVERTAYMCCILEVLSEREACRKTSASLSHHLPVKDFLGVIK